MRTAKCLCREGYGPDDIALLTFYADHWCLHRANISNAMEKKELLGRSTPSKDKKSPSPSWVLSGSPAMPEQQGKCLWPFRQRDIHQAFALCRRHRAHMASVLAQPIQKASKCQTKWPGSHQRGMCARQGERDRIAESQMADSAPPGGLRGRQGCDSS